MALQGQGATGVIQRTATSFQCRTFSPCPRAPLPQIYLNSLRHDRNQLAEKSTKLVQQRHQSTSPASRDISPKQEKQARTPWHREGSDKPPVEKPRPGSTWSKGKLLTTPSRLLKLIIPLSSTGTGDQAKDVEPLALLIHPQQPLSYLERLIQSEIPSIKDDKGNEKIPRVYFKAEDSQQDEIEPRAPGQKIDDTPEDLHLDAEQEGDGALDEQVFDGKREKTGKLGGSKRKSDPPPGPTQSLGDGNVESYHGTGDGLDDVRPFVRWSPSTEIGDFIRDAARGKEFAVEIENAPKEIRIGVPSFNDRTHYLRLRLRKTASKIIDLAAIKKECDVAAHRGAQRVALGGAGLLVAYWYTVYRLTFETDLGWDVMEPVTYLVGLSTLIAGYLWFLYHNREVSYRSALNLTISRRQTKLYETKGFEIQRWETLIEEANAYRKEIKQIASEYDVDWDERTDEKDQRVTDAMRKVRNQQGDGSRSKKSKKGDDDDDDDDDDVNDRRAD